MPRILELNRFSLSTESTVLLEDVSAQISDGQRVALVGPNGCGKSTLLRALQSPDATDYFLVGAGSISGPLEPSSRPPGAVLFVEQDDLQWSRLLWTADIDEEELRSMTVSEALDMTAAAGDDGAVEDSESWRRIRVAADDVLGWKTAAYETTPIGQLSPGCAMRAYLAVALNRRGVRLLLLDEPTNHLDLPSVFWLQHSIVESGKAIVVVSHDGAFLDAVADHLWDLDPDKHSLTVSGASFSAFQHAKELALEQQRVAFDSQQKRHKRLTAVADKLRASSASGERHKAKDHDLLQRDFRRNRAGRSGKKAKAVESLRDSEPLVERVARHTPLRIKLEDIGAGTRSSIIMGSAVLGYESRGPLPLAPVSLRIDFGDRLAIVGFNGIGKSTLLRTLTGELQPVDGEVTVGRDLRFGNLTQEHETLPREETPRQYIAALTNTSLFEAGAHLIRYGLPRFQVDRVIGELNPGARARALLASFAHLKVNTLVLDEPTNHLDEEGMREVIATLSEFNGTVIVVSHNRQFLDALEFSRVLLLSPNGLVEIESIDMFMDVSEEAARDVVAKCSW